MLVGLVSVDYRCLCHFTLGVGHKSFADGSQRVTCDDVLVIVVFWLHSWKTVGFLYVFTEVFLYADLFALLRFVSVGVKNWLFLVLYKDGILFLLLTEGFSNLVLVTFGKRLTKRKAGLPRRSFRQWAPLRGCSRGASFGRRRHWLVGWTSYL